MSIRNSLASCLGTMIVLACLAGSAGTNASATAIPGGPVTDGRHTASRIEAAPPVDDLTVAPAPDLVVIDGAFQGLLQEHDVPVVWKGATFFLAEWSREQQQEALGLSIGFRVLAPGFSATRQLYIFEMHDGEDAPAEWFDRMLYRKGRNVVLEVEDETAQEWMTRGYHGIKVYHRSYPWAAPMSLVPYTCTYDPLVASLLAETSQTQWMDWIEKMSGVEPVTIGGTSYSIQTRNSVTSFSGATHAKGFDWLLQQVQGWNYPAGNIEQDPFTLSGSTCKNLILTIPGQTSPSEVVLLTAHFDSISQTSPTVAPGANDNGTGSATLLEAARILRQYRFGRTVKIIWFTGEEQGLIGSAAYVADHSQASHLGVLNLDMFGYDGNNDRCFEIHIGTLPQSLDVGNCFSSSITSYNLGLTRDFLTTGATDRSDHASFWQASVGAIEIAENFFSNGQAGGCVGQDNNPGYHTTSDVIATNMRPSYGFDIAKAALATISSMAIPIQACFTGTPSLTAAPGNAAVELDWSALAGAAKYRAYRSTQGCDGQWTQIADTTGTSWVDHGARQDLTYSFRVEAVAADGFCVSAMSNCASAVPLPRSGPPILLIDDDNNTPDVRPYYTAALDSLGAVYDVWDVSAGGPPLEPGFGTVANYATTIWFSGDNFGGPANPKAGPTAASESSLASFLDLGSCLFISSQDYFYDRALTSFMGSYLGVSAVTNDVQHSVINNGGGAVFSGFGSSPLTFPPGLSNFSDRVLPGATAETGLNGNLGPAAIDRNSGTYRTIYFGFPYEAFPTPSTRKEVMRRILTFCAGPCPAIALAPASLPDGSVGGPYSQALTASGGNSPYTYAVTAGSLPPDLALSSAGLITGTPTSPGSHSFTVTTTDATGVCTGASAYGITVGGSAAPGEPAGLTLQKSGTDLAFAWTAPAGGCGVSGYAIYRGSLSTLPSASYSHDTSVVCGGAATSFQIPMTDPSLGTASYFLVVAMNPSAEGSYGRSSSTIERPASAAACRPIQVLSGCP